jgi:hypothetical protein
MVKLFGRKKKTAAPMGRLARIRRRILRSLGFVLGTLLLLVSLLFLSLLIGPTRGLMLTAGLHVAGTFLPGDLAVGKAAWPRPGHLVFRDLVWTGEERVAAQDTLVDLALLDLNFDFDALRSREVQVDSLTLRVRSLDLPVLLATVAPGEEALPDSTEVREEPVEPPQAVGALSGIPSVAVDRFDLEVERARVAPDLRISDVAVKARLEAGRSQGPLVKVSEASGRLRGGPDTAGPGGIGRYDLDPRRRPHDGLGRAGQRPPHSGKREGGHDRHLRRTGTGGERQPVRRSVGRPGSDSRDRRGPGRRAHTGGIVVR